jgi:phospholipid transport system substrate-binding protein
VPFNDRVFQNKSGTWKVYDVIVENVSLVINYRSQFSESLDKGTPAELLEILRKKVKGQKT